MAEVFCNGKFVIRKDVQAFGLPAGILTPEDLCQGRNFVIPNVAEDSEDHRVIARLSQSDRTNRATFFAAL